MARRKPKGQMSIITTESLIEESMEFLRKYEPSRGYFLGFSGGKDSVVIEHLCRLAGVKFVAGYTKTTVDPPELMKFIIKHYPEVQWFKPKKAFFARIPEKCPPLATARWCCDEMKEMPGIKEKRKYPIHVVGIRAEESAKRARRPTIDISNKMKVVTLKPIHHWTEYHVWDFIDKHELPYCSLYDEGFDRIGCVVCPMMFHKNQAKLNMHRERWPGMYRAFELAVKQWYEKMQFTDCRHGSFEAYMEAYYSGFENPVVEQSLQEA